MGKRPPMMICADGPATGLKCNTPQKRASRDSYADSSVHGATHQANDTSHSTCTPCSCAWLMMRLNLVCWR